MQSVPPLEPDEILLRRVPPSTAQFKTVEIRDDGTERAASNAMKPRKNPRTGKVEVALSCSRLRFTSPSQLLEHLSEMDPPIDPTGWRVCFFRVADVEHLKDRDDGRLEVHVEPRLEVPRDIGHCGIYGANHHPCPDSRKAAQRLAALTTMLTEEQVRSLNAGDKIESM